MDIAMWPNLIASFALIISVVSALLAWKTSREARIANRISIHDYQRSLYEAFFNARTYLQMKGQFSEVNEFSKLYFHIQTAKLYVDDALVEQLIDFYEGCISLSDLRVALAAAEQDRHMLESYRLIGGELGYADQHLVEVANRKQENCIFKLEQAVDDVLGKASAIDEIFVKKIKLS